MTLTLVQYRTLMALGGGPSRCSYGDPSHTALFRRGLVSIQHVGRRDYILTRTAAGEAAVAQWIRRKAQQKSRLSA